MAIGQILLRRGTTAAWGAANPVLAAGEFGYDTTEKRAKIGDGSTSWTGLTWAMMSQLDVARLEAAADALQGATAPTDAAMTSVQNNSTSAFAQAQRAAMGVLDSSGAGDAAPAINAALAPLAGTGRTLALRGDFSIGSTVIVPTGCRFDTSQAVVRSAAGFTGNMLRLNTGALRTITASIAAGSLIVTAAAGAFTSSDIGRSIIVPEAGPDVINAELGTGLKKQNLTGVVTAVASDGSSATLNRAATQAASGKVATVHNRVADVTLDLGVWDRGDNAGSGTNLHSIFLRRGDRVRLRSLKYRARFQSGTLVGGKYGVSYGDMVDFDAGELGLDFRSNSDGIHGIGPLIRPRIRNVTGETHDDLVAIGISDYADYADVAGPIVDPVVENVTATAEARAVLITANIRSEYQITGGVIRTVRGTTQSPLVRVTGANDIAGNISGHTGVPSIRLDDIQGTPRTVSPLVSLNARIGSVLITGANLKQTSGNGGVLQIDEYSTVDSVTIQGLAVADGHTGNLVEVPSTSALRSLTISDAGLVKSGTGCLVYGGGVIERVTLRNFRQQGGRGMDIRRDSAVCQIMLENVETDVPILRPSGGSTQLTVFTAGRVLYTGTTEGLVRLAGGTPSCFVHAGEGLISASGRIVSRAATDKPIRGSGLTFRQPVSELTPQPGDVVFNTVAAAVAVGLAYFDGTDSTWKMLGATGSAGGITPPTAPGEPVNGVVGSDSFTTARAELSGSAPDGVGGPWAGATNTWVVQDGRAKSLGSAPGTSPTSLECRAKGDWRATWTWRVATSGEAASRTERYFAMMIDGNNGIRLQRTGQTAASLTVAVVTGGTARTIITFAASTIPSNTAAADYAAVMEVVKNTSTGEGAISVTVNGVTMTGTATAAEMTALEAATRFGMGTTSPLTEIDNLSVSVNGTRVA